MLNQYDIIIVGAGPGGSTAAYYLARAGFKSLLLEKEKLPRYKPCGGGVTAKVKSVLDVDFTPTIEDTIERLSVAFGSRNRFRLNLGHTLGWSVMRDKFDALLATSAAKAGAEVRDHSPVTRVVIEAEGVRVHTAREELRASVLIGADGANGLVARAAGLQNTRVCAAALEAEMDLPSAAVEMWRGVWHFDYGAIPGGYGWIFPKAEHLSVGIGKFLRGGARPNLRQTLQRYLASEPTLQAPKNILLRGHLLPMRDYGEPLHAARVLLVGDAAALVDPFTGEGIYAAIKSGKMAAEETARAFTAGDFSFANYSTRLQKEFLRDYRYAWRLNDIFYRVPRVAIELLAHLKSLQRATANIVLGNAGYRNSIWGILKHPI